MKTFARLLLAVLITCVGWAHCAYGATITFDGGPSSTGTALDNSANWAGDVLPTTTDEVLFGTVPAGPASITTTPTSPTYGNLIWNQNNSSAITINTGTANNRTITLSGLGGSTAAIANGGAAGDLLLMGTSATTNTLTVGGNIGGGTGQLFLALGTSGAFNVVNAGATLDVTTPISGTGFGLTKRGAGTLIMRGLNTYTGGTTVDGGVLELRGTNGAQGAIFGTLTINSGATARVAAGQWTLGYDSSANYVQTININGGTLNFTVQGGTNAQTFNLTGGAITGNFDLYNFTTASGDVDFNTLASATTSTMNSTIQMRLDGNSAAGGTLKFNIADGTAATDLLFSGSLIPPGFGGGQRVEKNGAGRMQLTGSSTYGGSTTINAGTLSITNIANGGAASAIGNSSSAAANLVLNGGTLQYSGTAATPSTDRSFTLNAGTTSTIDIENAATNLTISGGSAATTGALIKTGLGTLTLSGINSHTGGTTVNGGTLALTAGGNEAGRIRGALTIGSAGIVNADTSWSLGYGTSQVVSSIEINGGTLNFSGGANNGGTVASSITMTGGTLSGSNFDWYGSITATPSVITNASLTTSTISSGFRIRENVTSVTLNVADGGATTDLLISGSITQTAAGRAIIKTGSGTLALTNTNTYSGATTISAGTLSITNIANGGVASAIGNSSSAAANLVLNGSTLQYSGTDATPSTDRSFTLNAGTISTIDVANAATNLTISGGSAATTGALVKAGLGTLTLAGTNSHTGGTTVNSGVLTLQGAGSSVGVIRGELTINSGAEARITNWQWSLGYDAVLGTFVDKINITGGTLNFAVVGGTNAQTFNMTGGTISGSSFDLYNFNTTPTSDVAFNTLASSATATVSAPINMRLENGTGGTLNFNVADGSAATDLLISGGISGNATQNVAKNGAGTAVFSSGNSYGGATTITGGTLDLDGNINGSREIIINRTTGAASNTNGRLLIDTAGTRTLGNTANGTGDVIVGDNGFGYLQHGAANPTSTAATSNIGRDLVVGRAAGGSGLVDVNNGTTLNVGQHTRVAANNTATGTVNVNSGAIMNVAQTLFIGNGGTGTGTVNVIAGGTLNVNGNTTIVDGGPGILNIAGAYTEDGDLIVGQNATGIVTQTAGTAHINDNFNNTGNLILGQSTAAALGTYELSGGTLHVHGSNNTASGTAFGNTNVGVAGRGIVNHSAGTFLNDSNMTIGGAVAGSQYNLTGTGVLNFGDRQPGTQFASTTNAASTLKINANGAFNFNGGTLMNVTTIDATSAPLGRFTQNGGRFVIGVDGGLTPNNGVAPAEAQCAMTTIMGDYVQNPGSTLVIDVFGNLTRSHMGSENVGKVGPAYDPITGLITDSDLVWVQGNATLDGTLQINLNGVNPGAWAWYDVLVANQITITDGKLDLVGLSSWRIINDPSDLDPSNGIRQILQVAAPEPASIALWSGVGMLLAGVYFFRLRKT